MRICLINNLYKPYARGGAEHIVEMTAEDLVKDGHEVTVVSTKPYFSKKNAITGVTKNIYIPGTYHHLGEVPIIFRLFWHIGDMLDVVNFFKIFFILRKGKFDLVLTHNLTGIGFLTPLAIKLLKIRHVHTLHDIQLIHPSGLMLYGEEGEINSWLARIYQFLAKLLFGSPQEVIAPSGWLLARHKERGFFKKSILTIKRNGSMIKNKPCAAKAQAEKPFRFLYAGQIEKHKGVRLLIEAFKKIKRDGELFIVGSGSILDEIKGMAKNDLRIKILGNKSREEVRDLMRGADCLVVPSLCYENSPTVIYEAFENSLAVIASNLGGIPELLDNDQDFLFKPEEDELKRKLEWMMDCKK